ncbi:hypothetical protein [Cyclobacterium sediminis]
MLKPKTKEFACVREALNFSRKDTQRWGFLLTSSASGQATELLRFRTGSLLF